MIRSLIATDEVAQRAAHSGSQEKRYEARERCKRFERIIYFLRSRSHTDTATETDRDLYEMLAEKLCAKGRLCARNGFPSEIANLARK